MVSQHMAGTPAQMLVGKKVGKWLVTQKCPPKANSTGGCNSVQYKVCDDEGNSAFLKAADLFVENTGNDLWSLELNLRMHRYEADILALCEGRSMDGIVRSLEAGEYIERIGGLPARVPYIVFEEAESDVRSHQKAEGYDLGWRLRIFHGVCVAMRQLHNARIAHQDLKPSNVLVFNGQKAKVADLGRATMEENPSFFQMDNHVGDNNYCPIELIYKNRSSMNWLQRRLGADFFMMGCLLTFLATNSSLLTLIFERLEKRFWPDNWAGTYDEVSPHINYVLESVLEDIRNGLPAKISGDIVSMIYMFSNPDPAKRGNLSKSIFATEYSEQPFGEIAQQYDLERAISKFDKLSLIAAIIKCDSNTSLNMERFLNFYQKNR